MKIVIASSYDQYKRYLRETEQSPRDAVYIAREAQLWGLRGVEIVKYEDWWNSPIAHSDGLRDLERWLDAETED